MKSKAGWYKVSTGLPQDAKLAVVAKRTGFRRGEVLAVWVALLDHASAADPRGSVSEVDAEEIAAVLECDAAAVANVIAMFYEREMILPSGLIPFWQKYQDLSTPRTRAYRARRHLSGINQKTVIAAALEESDAARRQRLMNLKGTRA